MSQSLFQPESGQGWGSTSPKAGSGLLWAVWVHGLQNCGSLASEFCLLVGNVGKVGPEAREDFLEGRASACPLVGRAGPGLLVCSVVSRGMCRGDCGLRKYLGNLSSSGWSYAPPPPTFSFLA